VKKLMFAIVFLCLARVMASAQQLSAANVSSYLGNSTWNWTIFLTGPKGVLDTVSYVEYTLHPTFPNPVRRVNQTTDPRYPFGLTTSGWGTFNVGIKVVFKNGQVRNLTHSLQFVSASQNSCGSPIKLLSQHLAFLSEEPFKNTEVTIHVDKIADEWTKTSPTLTLFYGNNTKLNTKWAAWEMQAAHDAARSPSGTFVSTSEFQSAMKATSPESKWSMNVQHDGDAMQFRYNGHYYFLIVTKVNAGLGDNSSLDLEICESLPSAAPSR
jgi:transcription initiation factor IIF auxiliary subunit